MYTQLVQREGTKAWDDFVTQGLPRYKQRLKRQKRTAWVARRRRGTNTPCAVILREYFPEPKSRTVVVAIMTINLVPVNTVQCPAYETTTCTVPFKIQTFLERW